MNRELLNKAKEIEDKIVSIEMIKELDNDTLRFFVEDNNSAILNWKFEIPKSLNESIMDILLKYKCECEKQLEEL